MEHTHKLLYLFRGWIAFVAFMDFGTAFRSFIERKSFLGDTSTSMFVEGTFDYYYLSSGSASKQFHPSLSTLQAITQCPGSLGCTCWWRQCVWCIAPCTSTIKREWRMSTKCAFLILISLFRLFFPSSPLPFSAALSAWLDAPYCSRCSCTWPRLCTSARAALTSMWYSRQYWTVNILLMELHGELC